MNRAAKNVFFGVLVLSPLLYISTCSVISHSREAAFDAISPGDTKESVLKAFGSSPLRERAAGEAFLRYASHPCSAPCEERWWFENRMSFDTEAWSIEFDGTQRVARKVRWSSP